MSRFMVKGRVWKFGDDVDTDLIIPGRYLMLRNMDEMASHVLENVAPEFAREVRKGDVVVAGRNFGCGSSREAAPMLLRHLGVGAVVAESFARIFFRNSINLGLPLAECNNISKNVEKGHQLEVDLKNGVVKNLSTGKNFNATKLPDFLLDIIDAGGAVEALRRKLRSSKGG